MAVCTAHGYWWCRLGCCFAEPYAVPFGILLERSDYADVLIGDMTMRIFTGEYAADATPESDGEHLGSCSLQTVTVALPDGDVFEYVVSYCCAID